eukprot:Rmarinus@m.19460
MLSDIYIPMHFLDGLQHLRVFSRRKCRNPAFGRVRFAHIHRTCIDTIQTLVENWDDLSKNDRDELSEKAGRDHALLETIDALNQKKYPITISHSRKQMLFEVWLPTFVHCPPYA